MSLDGLSAGISHTLSFVDPVQGTLQFTTAIKSFTSKPDTQTDKFVQMDGRVRHPKFHTGGSGSFVVGRDSSYIDDYFINQQNQYLSGQNQVDVTITETILESDGSTTQYQYVNCVLSLDDSGEWSGTAIVEEHVSFMYEKKTKLS